MIEWLDQGITPFAGIGWWAIAAVAAAHAFGCFIRGAFGFGSNMPIVIITTFLLGPHHAILLALMTTLVAQAHLLPQGIRTADWQVSRLLIIGMIAGTATGTWLFTLLSPDRLVLVLGFLISGIIVMDAFHLVEKLTTHIDLRSKRVTTGFSFIGGLMGGVSGAGAFYFLIVYLKHVCQSAAALRGTNVMLSSVTMMTRLIALIAAGMITPTLVTEGLLLSPIVFAATWFGAHIFKISTPQRFFVALQVLLLAGAVSLTVKGLIRLFE